MTAYQAAKKKYLPRRSLTAAAKAAADFAAFTARLKAAPFQNSVGTPPQHSRNAPERHAAWNPTLAHRTRKDGAAAVLLQNDV
jgi:hypothetical protein